MFLVRVRWARDASNQSFLVYWIQDWNPVTQMRGVPLGYGLRFSLRKWWGFQRRQLLLALAG